MGDGERRTRAELSPGLSSNSRIWIVGPRPAAANGQSLYTQEMAARLERLGEVRWLPIGPGVGNKVVAALINPLTLLFFCRDDDRLYLTPPGNRGLWLFLPTVLAVRALGRHALVHHHSFRALNLARAPLSTRLLVSLGGRRQRHVLLCERMRSLFLERFSADCPGLGTLTLSNAHLFPELPMPPSPTPVGVIGCMSVLTREKGIDHLLAVFERVLNARPDARLILAGPVADPALMSEIDAAIARHPGAISYRGPVSGASKAEFFRDISIFAFPTRLVDEADPLVLLEAYGAGRDVISTVTGCIEERLRPAARRLTLNLAEDAVSLLDGLKDVDEASATVSALCLAHAQNLKRTADRQATVFYEALSARASSRARAA